MLTRSDTQSFLSSDWCYDTQNTGTVKKGKGRQAKVQRQGRLVKNSYTTQTNFRPLQISSAMKCHKRHPPRGRAFIWLSALSF